MIARGSLRYCIEAAASAFQIQHYDRLAILCNPAGKYYSIATEEDLNKMADVTGSGVHRLVFFGTRRELQTFADRRQQDLFDGGSDDAP